MTKNYGIITMIIIFMFSIPDWQVAINFAVFCDAYSNVYEY